MYVLLYPFGGFNDILKLIDYVLSYCKQYNRILLVPTFDHYHIYASSIFNIENSSIILDCSSIYQILDSSSITIYPSCITKIDILNIINPENREKLLYYEKFKYTFKKNTTNTHIVLPNKKVNEDIIFFAHHGCFPGNSFRIFSQLTINNQILKNEMLMRINNKIPKSYLCIQVRGCDCKTNWKSYYEIHKSYIHGFKHIYLCTDDKDVLEFYKKEGLSIYNFTTYPNTSYHALHMSNLSGYTKFLDLLCDLYIASNASAFLSNSNGGFVKLMRKCINHKEIVYKLLHDE